MRTIGLIGGMSWESTVIYYQMLNRMARERLGGLHSAQIIMWSFDFAQIEAYQAAGDWRRATDAMIEAARSVERAGAECLLICTNTMHKMAGEVDAATDIPLIHIADATASGLKKRGSKNPLLLATRYTMEQSFYKGRLADVHGIDVIIPNATDRGDLHRIIYDELCQGEILPTSKERFLNIIETANGVDGVILGCTEIGLLINQSDISVPTFDTTALHAQAAIDFALANSV